MATHDFSEPLELLVRTNIIGKLAAVLLGIDILCEYIKITPQMVTRCSKSILQKFSVFTRDEWDH